jgi:hypothetical protein
VSHGDVDRGTPMRLAERQEILGKYQCHLREFWWLPLARAEFGIGGTTGGRVPCVPPGSQCGPSTAPVCDSRVEGGGPSMSCGLRVVCRCRISVQSVDPVPIGDRSTGVCQCTVSLWQGSCALMAGQDAMRR